MSVQSPNTQKTSYNFKMGLMLFLEYRNLNIPVLRIVATD